MDSSHNDNLGKRAPEPNLQGQHFQPSAAQPEVSNSNRKYEFAYNTRENTLYNLTPHSQSRLSVPFINLNSPDLLSIADVIGKLPPSLSLRQFLGIQPSQRVYLSTLSHEVQTTKGINKDTEVSLLSRNSFKNFSNQQFLSFARGLRADLVVGLSEEKAHGPKMPVGKKSDHRAVKKTLKFLDELIAQFETDNTLGKPATHVLAPLIDTEFDDIRQEMVQNLIKRAQHLSGIMVYGTNGLPSKEPPLAVFCDRFASIVRDLEPILDHSDMKDKLVGSSSNGDPVDVLFKINNGFNFFESSYPFLLAEKGLALDLWPLEWEREYHSYQDYNLDLVESLSNGKQRLNSNKELFNKECPLLNLKEKRFMDEKEPIFGGLYPEYPFNGYSKAYICHLLNNDEMTGNVLLTLHNCYIYQQFFSVLNGAYFRKNTLGMIYSFCNLVCKKRPN